MKTVLQLGLLTILLSMPQKVETWSADINNIRQTARLIPGRGPLRINVLKFAESHRAKKFSVKGAPDEPSVQARTVFQIVYADGYIMLDAGMDQQVHNFFGRGVAEPYDSNAANQIEQALIGARSILVTHEHGDHVAGVIHSPLANQLAPKTILTRDQVKTLLSNPQMPEIQLTPELASRYHIIDYEKYLPFGPGIALIKAPGHTPGSQMVYIRLDSGKEYLFIGDTAWHMDGVRQIKGKDAPWIQEDEESLKAQLTWLNKLYKTEPDLSIIASHDEEQRRELIEKHLLGGNLEH